MPAFAQHWTTWLIVVSWFGYLFYWVVAAVDVKRDAAARGWSRRNWILTRLAFISGVLWLAHYRPVAFHRLFTLSPTTPRSPTIADAGAILCALGVAFAIWARRHLGSNWSPQPSLKVGHELVITGPYRFVRHPIYTGFLAALLGTALAGSPFWLIVLAFALVTFLRRVAVEDGIMAREFPLEYPQYKARTKALIPFLW